jgi:hypothetical protein
MVQKRINFCIIDFDDASSILSVRALVGSLNGVALKYGKQTIKAKDINQACGSYWKFVDDSIKAGELSDGDNGKIEQFFDELITNGTTLCSKILGGFDATAHLGAGLAI